MENVSFQASFALTFFFGLIIGSFLNVVIYRLPRGISIIRPRSFCPACDRQLTWYENVPLFSYLFLWGRCRTCRETIPVRYVLVELLAGLLSFYIFFRFPSLWTWFFYFCLLIAPLMAVAFIDLEHRIIPNEITLPGILCGFLVHYVDGIPFSGYYSVLDSLLGVLAGGGFLFLVGFIYEKFKKQEGLGGGDVKLAAMLGAFFGWQGVLAILLISSVLGSLIGIVVVALKRDFRYQLPFGVFIALAGAIELFWGKELLFWYLSFF